MPHRDLSGLRRDIETLRQHNAQLEAQLQQQQDQDNSVYRFLFDTMDEGFCIFEFLDGPHGPLSDYVHVIANAAYAKHAGIPGIAGGSVGPAIELHYSINDQLWPTFIDTPQLESALLNLCLNARDALPDGDKVLLYGENLSVGRQRAQALGLLPGDYLHLAVEDNELCRRRW